MGLVRKYFERRYEQMSPEEKADYDARMREQVKIGEAHIAAAHARQAAADQIQEQEALKRAAEVRGYPTVEDYLRAEAIRQGLYPWQPTYVVPQAG